MNILVTGGAGYIGSHLVKKLLETTDHNIFVVDSLITGSLETLNELQKIRNFSIYLVNLQDDKDVNRLSYFLPKIDLVYHFAGSLIVSESVNKPIEYYKNNVTSTINLLTFMKSNSIKNIVFSSTAAVYGTNFDMVPLNPYGKSKKMVEDIIKDYKKADSEFNYTILRYFNVAGASLDNTIGQKSEVSTHLIKIASEVATGKKDSIEIFGDDYDTKDGTCIRDYIHVEDLVDIHILGAKYMMLEKESNIFNAGYGKGYSVKEVIDIMQKISYNFKVNISPRRAGDPDILIANNIGFTKKTLGWEPKYDNLEFICQSALNWEDKI